MVARIAAASHEAFFLETYLETRQNKCCWNKCIHNHHTFRQCKTSVCRLTCTMSCVDNCRIEKPNTQYSNDYIQKFYIDILQSLYQITYSDISIFRTLKSISKIVKIQRCVYGKSTKKICIVLLKSIFEMSL